MSIRGFGVLVIGVWLSSVPVTAAQAHVPLVDDVAPFKADLVKKLDDKQYVELERLEQELRASKARFAGGDWKLYHFYEALTAGHVIEDAPLESDWTSVIAALKEWQKHSPKSPLPALMLADAYHSYAWFARGTGRAETVKEGQWGIFKDRLNQAAFHLNASLRLSGNANPQWHTTALGIATGLEWPRDRAETLVKEAAAIEPLYQHAYSAMANYLLPQWFGERGDWERFAVETAERVGGLEGSAIYNHIVLRAARGYTRDAFLKDANVNWRKIQWSFADREKLYGTGVQPLNAMLRLSVGAGDHEASAAFLKRIGDSWDQSVWKTRQHFDQIKAYIERQ